MVGALMGLPGWPLTLSDEQAAAYVGLTLDQFNRAVSARNPPRGRLLAGQLHWSRLVLERWLDASPGASAGRTEADSLFDPVADAIDSMAFHEC
jgi:hypothetical protein